MNGKLLAIGMVAVMMIAGLAMLPVGDESDAAVGDGGSYTYVLNYDSTQMSVNWSTSTALSLADMDPIYHPAFDGVDITGYGDWTWNNNSGKGPFNSFYAAFDQTNGNRFVSVMDPFDLTHGIDGTDYTSQLADLNIMWVLPTVYWKSDSTHLYLTNEPGTDTDYKALAHTINGHVYNYLAIGVYEASMKNIGGQDVLTSQSGVVPSNHLLRSTFRTAAHAYGTDGELDSSLASDSSNPAYGMLWNFYQWELYKMCAYALMENFNSQNVVGNGHVYGSTYAFTTGATNLLGPYSGNPGIIFDDSTGVSYGSDFVKLFIENAWGGLNEFVDGIVVNANLGFYLDSKSTPDDSTNASTYVVNRLLSIPSSDYGLDIFTDADIWGYASVTSSGGSSSVGTTDKVYTATTGNQTFFVGGRSYPNASQAVYCGISFADSNHNLQTSNSNTGTRLAFVLDQIAPVITMSVNSEYGTLEGATTYSVPLGTAIAVSGDTITIGASTVTAMPDDDTAQYSYDFIGWTVGGDSATGTYQAHSDLDFVANFSRTLNSYTVTYDVSGVTTSETLDYGAMPDPEDPEAPEGYAFIGWDPELTAVIGNATYTAVFSEIGGITITLNAEGGSVSTDALHVTEGLPIGTLPTPTKTGFDFDGWFTAAEGGTEVTAETIVTDDMTIYAHWEITGTWNTYKVLVYTMITLLFIGIAVAILRNYVGGDRF